MTRLDYTIETRDHRLVVFEGGGVELTYKDGDCATVDRVVQPADRVVNPYEKLFLQNERGGAVAIIDPEDTDIHDRIVDELWQLTEDES